MRIWNNWKNQNWFPYTVAAVIGVAFYMLLNHIDLLLNLIYGIWTIVKPLLYGFILAYLIDPIARFYQRKPLSKMKKQKFSRNLSVVFAVITVLVGVGLLIAGVLPQLIKSITNIASEIAERVMQIDFNSNEFWDSLPFGLGAVFEEFSISDQMIASATEFVSDSLSNIADTSINIGTGIGNFMVAFILAIYYMMDKNRLQEMGNKFLVLIFREKKYGIVKNFIVKSDTIILKYIKGNLIEALVIGILNAAFMLIGRIPYVLLISIVIGITNIAPIFGPIVGAIIGAIMLVLINPWYAFAFLIFTVILQTLDGYIIKPRLFGGSFGVSPLLILIMIILGSRICGVIGILLAIPFAAIAQLIWDEIWHSHKSKEKDTNADNTK